MKTKTFFGILFLLPFYGIVVLIVNVLNFEWAAYRGPEIQRRAMNAMFGDDEDLNEDLDEAVEVGNSHSNS